MPTIHFDIVAELSPGAVLKALAAFGEHRPDVWPNIDHSRFRVHGLRVAVKTLESDSWAPGSWDYQLTREPSGGTKATVTRVGRGMRGRLIGWGLAWLGVGVLRSQTAQVLSRIR